MGESHFLSLGHPYCGSVLISRLIAYSYQRSYCRARKGSPFHSERHRKIIEKAVYEMRDITGADLYWTGLRNDNDFLEFCLKDYSETWLVQEIPEPKLSGEIRRQIKIVNRHLKGREVRHQRVVIILFVYQKLSYDEKASLLNQLQIFHSTETLSPKISFRVWEAKDIERVLED